MEIAFHLKSYVNQHQLGYVLTAPFEIHLAEKTRPVQPDVVFIGAERGLVRGAKYFNGPPDLVVEVLSPMLVELADFTATSSQDGTQMYWETTSEVDNLGFYILRATGDGWKMGDYSQVFIITFIPSQGNKVEGDSYSYMDTDVEPGTTYYYGLVDICSNEKMTIHGDFIEEVSTE